MLVTAVNAANTVASPVTQNTLAPRNTGASSDLKGSPKFNQITMNTKMHKQILDPDIQHRSNWEVAATPDSTEPRTDDRQYIKGEVASEPIHMGDKVT